MCDKCAPLNREQLLNAKASALPVEHLGDVLYVVASATRRSVTHDVEAFGDDWHLWPCSCEARQTGCIHARAAWLYVQRAARKAKRIAKTTTIDAEIIPF